VISFGTSATTNIVKVGLGTQIFSGANTYNGTTTISGGVLQFNTAASIGGSGASVTVTAGAAAAAGYAMDQAFLARIAPASAGAAALAVTSGNALNFSTAGLTNASLGAVGGVSFTGTLTPAGTTYRLGGGGGTLTLPNATQLTGANAVTIVGPGVVAPTGANDYTGVTTILSGGTFAPTVANGGLASGMGATGSAASNLVIDGGTFKGAGTTDRAFTLTTNGGSLDNSSGLNFSGPGSVVVPSIVNTTLTLTGASTAHNTFNLSLADAGGGFVTSVLKTGSGKWTFSADATKTYSGDTHIAAGQLEALSDDAFSHNSNLVIDAGASLELHDHSATINALVGSGAIVNSFVSGTRTLTIGAGNGGGTFGGVIASGPALNVIKSGTGTQVFTGANTYSGNTTVSGGVLTLAPTSSIVSTSITSNAGATLNVNGTIPATAGVFANGIVNFSGTGGSARTVDSLNVGANGQAKVLSSAFPATPAVLTVTTNLAFGSGGTLDLSNNELITSLPLATVRTNIANGKIFTSTVDGGTGALGSIDLLNGTVEVRYTLKGDANLDGKVDVGDLGALATNYGTSGNATWAMGDSNYDNHIDVGDLGALATNYGSSLASGPAAVDSLALVAMPTAAASSVPEPSGLALLGLGVVSALHRRRRARID
jgi:fibronectin-binding autotransporter adhesin